MPSEPDEEKIDMFMALALCDRREAVRWLKVCLTSDVVMEL